MKFLEGKNKIELLSQVKEEGPVAFDFVSDEGIFPFVKTVTNTNPVSTISQGIYLMSGRSDKNWVSRYRYITDEDKNKKEKDPYFRYSLGERIRYWGRSSHDQFIFNPQDQLVHAYEQIISQCNCNPVMQIYNPLFDNGIDSFMDKINANYIPCTISFKWKDNKLSMFAHYTNLMNNEAVDDFFTLSFIHHLLFNWIKTDSSVKNKGKLILGDLVVYVDNFIPATTLIHDSKIKLSDPPISFGFSDSLDFIDVYFSSLDNLFKTPELTAKTYKNILVTCKEITDDFYHDTILSFCSSRLIDNYLKTLEKVDLDKLFEVLSQFKSNWNIPIYYHIFSSDLFIIKEHLESKVDSIQNVKELINLYGNTTIFK